MKQKSNQNSLKKLFIFSLFFFLSLPLSSEQEPIYWIYTVEEYNALKDQVAEWQNKYASCNGDLQKCQQAQKQLTEKMTLLQRAGGVQQTELQKQINEYEEKIKQLESKQQKTVQQCKGIVKKYRAKLLALKKENTSLIDKLKMLSSEIATLKNINEKQKQQIEKMQNQFQELESKLQNEIQAGLIRLKKTRTRLTINLDERISFSSGSTVLKSQAKPALKKITAILAKYPDNLIYVEGHTDNVPMRSGRIRDNWQLSTERALSVLRYILKNNQIEPTRISAAGYGEFKPVAANDSKQNRALNRRVDLVVTIP